MAFKAVESSAKKDSNRPLLSGKDLRELQHEIKTHVQQYFKKNLGKGVETTKVIILEDMLIIRVGWFLTDSEKFILTTPEGESAVKVSRMVIAKQSVKDNLPYFEEKLKAKSFYQNYDIDPATDFGYCILIFDQTLTE